MKKWICFYLIRIGKLNFKFSLNQIFVREDDILLISSQISDIEKLLNF